MDFFGLTEAVWLAMFTNAVAAISFYLAYAAGMLNVSQVGFMAVGGYATALVATSERVPLWVGLLVGFIVITGVAVLLARLTNRLGGVYLAMATLAFVLVVQQLIVINPRLGGAVGIHGIPLLLHPWSAALVLIVVAAFSYGIMRSRLGYEMRVVREDQVVARSMGIDIPTVRIQTALLSAWVAGVAGAMDALHTSFIGPGDFGFASLILILSFAIVGGTDRWWGPIVGAVLLTILPETTRLLQAWREVLSGGLILGVMLLFPEGITGMVLRLRRLADRRRRSAPVVGQAHSETVGSSEATDGQKPASRASSRTGAMPKGGAQ